MKHVLDFTKGVTALGLRVTQAILNAVYAVIAALCRLLGVKPPAAPQIAPPAATPSSVMERFESALDREIERDHAPITDLGAAVHQYASARDPYIRGAVDLTCLSPDQYGWIMGLSDADLQRLAAAGPVACQRAVTGKRSGVVGLPEMRPEGVVETVPVDPRERVRDALRERIREGGGRKLAA